MEGARGWSLGSVEVNKKSSVAWQDWTMLTRIEPMGVQQLRFYGIVWKTHQTWGPRSVSAKKWLEVVQIPKIRVFFEANNLEPKCPAQWAPLLMKVCQPFFYETVKKTSAWFELGRHEHPPPVIPRASADRSPAWPRHQMEENTWPGWNAQPAWLVRIGRIRHTG